ncbi:MAG TPA: RsmE family RNA methyltransferase [Candidatus Hydrogenedentes bacterium]|nr:RsmE family RNA methyltransferase [Candidatus Hydrogenedentota bacterium]
MAHLHRFYIDATPISGQVYALPPDEAHHGLRVLRLQQGEPVTLFNGQGMEWRGRVEHCGKKELMVHVEEEKQVPQPSPRLTLAMGWLMKDKAIEFIIQHGTEAGVDRFCFFTAERSGRSPRLTAKWAKIAIEACKQCGRLWFPEMFIEEDLAAVLSRRHGHPLLATQHPDALPLPKMTLNEDVAILIGPEGDFTEKETISALRAGAVRVSLGGTTFRSEMAALVSAIVYRSLCV